MRQLRQYLEELLATSSNTIGMGGMTAPTEMNDGSGDIPIPFSACCKKRKLKKKCKCCKNIR